MPTTAPATDAHTVDLEEEPQGHEGEQECEGLDDGHGETVLWTAPKSDLKLRSAEPVSVSGLHAHCCFLGLEPHVRGGERDARVSANARRCESHLQLQPFAASLVARLSPDTTVGPAPDLPMHAKVVDG